VSLLHIISPASDTTTYSWHCVRRGRII